jgi:hypothetical protein
VRESALQSGWSRVRFHRRRRRHPEARLLQDQPAGRRFFSHKNTLGLGIVRGDVFGVIFFDIFLPMGKQKHLFVESTAIVQTLGELADRGGVRRRLGLLELAEIGEAGGEFEFAGETAALQLLPAGEAEVVRVFGWRVQIRVAVFFAVLGQPGGRMHLAD